MVCIIFDRNPNLFQTKVPYGGTFNKTMEGIRHSRIDWLHTKVKA
jgi:hypothetical protein